MTGEPPDFVTEKKRDQNKENKKNIDFIWLSKIFFIKYKTYLVKLLSSPWTSGEAAGLHIATRTQRERPR